ncbi:MAG: fumarylacetoacetate hydrolase family protein [Candidatus Marinimicrobia bacterium]|nr:fumarylacetoacetate hydrolase family protein [Candidatus Neomarinimicrobiota bacterium]|tara:strand:- start:2 stop:985 length:984 start_codon:yes stop_codon:yes gene_type:complete
MKFVTYTNNDGETPRFGFKRDDEIVDVIRSGIWVNENIKDSSFLTVPTTLKLALGNWDINFSKLKNLNQAIPDTDLSSLEVDEKPIAIKESEASLLPPVTNPDTFRDFYAFEQHVKAARKLRGLEMHPDWYKLPIFYFSNPTTLYGHGEIVPYPTGTEELDFELEFAIIIANGGQNIKKENADKMIAGYTILNDWSARDLQREEMQLNLGPAKGKDFANSFGPYMVTPDELTDAWDNNKLHLRMTCHVNGKLISDGNTNDLYHSFPTMIERASMNVDLRPGDYIGSGTVGTGCILELRPESTGGWLKRGDVVRLEIEHIGVLENTIV